MANLALLDEEMEKLFRLVNDADEKSQIHQRWMSLRSKFDVYAEDDDYAAFNNLPSDETFQKHIKKLTFATRALIFYGELPEEPTDPNIKKNILKLIDLALDKIEQRQLQTLRKIQRFVSDDYPEMIKRIKKESAETNETIKKNKYSKQLNGDSDAEKMLSAFFSFHENKFSLSEAIDKQVEKAKKAEAIFEKAQKVGKKVNTAAEALSEAGKITSDTLTYLKNFLDAIPIVSEALGAVPVMYRAIKTWYKNKSPLTKGLATAAAVVAIAGIVTSGLGPIAATVMAVVGFAVGTAEKHVVPYIKLRNKLKEAKDNLNFFKYKRDDYDKPINQLDPREKHILLSKLETSWRKVIDPEERKNLEKALTQAKDAIQHCSEKKLDGLNSNPLFKRVLEDNKQDNLNGLLKDAADKRIKELTATVNELKPKEKDRFWKLTSRAMMLTGIILVAIPTPVTIGIGLGLIGAGVSVSIGNKYSLATKVGKLFTKVKTAFTGSNVKDVNDVEMTEHPQQEKGLAQGVNATEAVEQANWKKATHWKSAAFHSSDAILQSVLHDGPEQPHASQPVEPSTSFTPNVSSDQSKKAETKVDQQVIEEDDDDKSTEKSTPKL